MVGLVLLMFTMQVFPGSDEPVTLSADGNVDGRKPKIYCGIYAAFGAATAVLQKSGQKPAVDFGELISKDYVSGLSGSSTQDILRAVERLGCKGHAYQFLSFRSLEDSKTPMILHVSGRGALGTYQHWILFLGIESGRAVVRDGEGGDCLMPLSELMCRWDGKAISVFPKQEMAPRLHSWEIAANCVLLGGMALLVLVFKSFRVNKAYSSQLLSFVALVSFALVYSFLVNPHVSVESALARSVDIHTHPDSLRTTTFHDLKQSVDGSKATVVDCRYRVDYDDGCIGESISIPVDISQAKLEEVTKKIRKDFPVVLYCQSRGCKFSIVIAVELAKQGFTDLRIYKNGYAEWESKTR